MIYSQEIGNEQTHLASPGVRKVAQDRGTENRANCTGSSGDLLLPRCEGATTKLGADVGKSDTNDTGVIAVEETAKSGLSGSTLVGVFR
jgi:hypothetical protein